MTMRSPDSSLERLTVKLEEMANHIDAAWRPRVPPPTPPELPRKSFWLRGIIDRIFRFLRRH